MPESTPSPSPYGLAALKAPGALLRLGIIGVAILAGAGAFAYAGGWLTPGLLTPAGIIDTF